MFIMDKKLERVTKNTFNSGSIRDAVVFLDMCIKSAFPEFHFRGIEVTNLMATKKIVEGKSWNHVFKITSVTSTLGSAWEISCHRVSHGSSTDKKVMLDAETLRIINQ